MVDMTKSRKEVPRKQLLYDEARLETLVDEFGNAIEIKENVKTTAFIYEIRTAIEYWFGGQADRRTSRGIWNRCKAVDDGMWVVVGDEFKDAADVTEGGRP
jgi:hypothetical protein